MTGSEVAIIAILMTGSTALLVRCARRTPDPLTGFLDAAERWIKADEREANCARVDAGRDLSGVLRRLAPRMQQFLNASAQVLQELSMLRQYAQSESSPHLFMREYLARPYNRAYLRMIETRFHLRDSLALRDAAARLRPLVAPREQEAIAGIIAALDTVQEQQEQVAMLRNWLFSMPPPIMAQA
ncbi:MAG: hypothetical protein QY326_08085 [Bdellovibrionota bacterium]|nr:MAG: hypothetical protein QY326_08085 [Bdellovibrionota bacterium]